MDVSEEQLLEAIRKVLSGAGPEVRVGAGDDAAVLAPGSGELVLTTDALVEGVHFVLGVTSPRDLGYKAIAVNVSDVAAMAASPRYAVCALTLSPDVDAAWTMELFGGMRECCDEFALWLVGGNLARGTEVTVVVSVLGEVSPGRAVLRSGARADDLLVVTGALGISAAGLRLSRAGARWSDDERLAIKRHLRPTPRVGEAGVLARHGATAMIDLSDGLALDLDRICRRSGVGATVRLDDVPVAPVAGLDEALGGGEDYELLAAMPDDAAVRSAREELREAFGVPLTQIGRIIEGERVIVVDASGEERPLDVKGWDHFR
jgi:thiamine-monophosphate kinase